MDTRQQPVEAAPRTDGEDDIADALARVIVRSAGVHQALTVHHRATIGELLAEGSPQAGPMPRAALRGRLRPQLRGG